MKKVEALVLAEHLEAIQLALVDAGISDLSVLEAGQFEESRQPGEPVVYSVSPRVKIEIFCEDHDASRIGQIFSVHTLSRTRDSARVFVTQVEETVRLRLPYVAQSSLSPISR